MQLSLSVSRLTLKRVYCDKNLKRGLHGFYSTRCIESLVGKFDDEIPWVSLEQKGHSKAGTGWSKRPRFFDFKALYLRLILSH